MAKVYTQGESQSASNGAQHHTNAHNGQPASALLDGATIRTLCRCATSSCECHTTNGHVHCPAHNDTHPSLSVDERDGKTLFVCRSGCEQPDVLAALRRAAGHQPTNTTGSAPKPTKSPAKGKPVENVFYTYTDENGEVLYRVNRQKFADGSKNFPTSKPDGRGGWEYKIGDTRRVLYRLPDVKNAQIVFICEGEKAADAFNDELKHAGLFGKFVATTNAGGAGKWRDEFCAALVDVKHIYVLPDNDAQGAKHGESVCASIDANGCGELVWRLDLPGLPPKGDVCDWLDAGGTVGKLIDLLPDAAMWTPPTKPDNVSSLGARALRPEPKSKRPTSTGLTAADLLDADFPETKWIIPGVLPEGSSVLAGHPKLGKSWLALGWGIAVACGGLAFGKIKVPPGDVLYLALEDNPRRMKARLEKVLQGDRPEGLERLHVFHEWERLDGGGLVRLDAWLSEHPDARLIIIDTFQKVKPRAKAGGNAYETDYEAAAPLNQLAAKWGVSVVSVHHLRKSDSADDVEAVSGSYGITGAADAILGLRRQRGQCDAVLSVTGRDVEEAEHALKWQADFGAWEMLGDAREFKITNERAEVVNALRAVGEPVTPKQLFERTGVAKSLSNLKTMLWRMAKDEEAISENGRYSAPESNSALSGNTSNPSNPSNPVTLFESENTPKPKRAKATAADSEPYGTPSSVTQSHPNGVTQARAVTGAQPANERESAPVTPVTPVTQLPQHNEEEAGVDF